MAVTHPLVLRMEATVPAVGTAGNDDTAVIGVVPYAGVVTAVTYIPKSDVTGAATNNRTVSVINTGAAGNGTTAVASLNFGNGTNASDYDERALTLSATAADLVVAAGDVLKWSSLHIGTGITDPGGMVAVTISRS